MTTVGVTHARSRRPVEHQSRIGATKQRTPRRGSTTRSANRANVSTVITRRPERTGRGQFPQRFPAKGTTAGRTVEGSPTHHRVHPRRWAAASSWDQAPTVSARTGDGRQRGPGPEKPGTASLTERTRPGHAGACTPTIFGGGMLGAGLDPPTGPTPGTPSRAVARSNTAGRTDVLPPLRSATGCQQPGDHRQAVTYTTAPQRSLHPRSRQSILPGGGPPAGAAAGGHGRGAHAIDHMLPTSMPTSGGSAASRWCGGGGAGGWEGVGCNGGTVGGVVVVRPVLVVVTTRKVPGGRPCSGGSIYGTMRVGAAMLPPAAYHGSMCSARSYRR